MKKKVEPIVMGCIGTTRRIQFINEKKMLGFRVGPQ